MVLCSNPISCSKDYLQDINFFFIFSFLFVFENDSFDICDSTINDCEILLMKNRYVPPDCTVGHSVLFLLNRCFTDFAKFVPNSSWAHP